VIRSYNNGCETRIHPRIEPVAGSDLSRRGQVQLRPAFLYNPGLVDSWFIVTGVFGLLLILNKLARLLRAMCRERRPGTIEQC